MRKSQRAEAVKSLSRTDCSARERIIAAAAMLFRARGYAAVSLRDIAAAAGLTTGSVYHHFASKDDAVREVLGLAHELVLRSVHAAVADLPADASPADKLRAAVTAHIVSLLGENSLPAANMRIFSQVPRHVRGATLPLRHACENYWFELLRDCRKDGVIAPAHDVEVLTALLFGAMNWLLEWYSPGRYSIEAIVQQIVGLVASDVEEQA
jgi:AcrR family transcriptional regulator